MRAAAVPANERERLAALRRYAVLDTPEDVFEDIVQVACEVTGAPIGLVSLLDEDRQWFKAGRGFDATGMARELSFCAHAILEPDQVMVVPDLSEDERFADHPLVAGPPHARFYAGAPLLSPEGLPLGTVCVLGFRPVTLTDGQKEALRALARMVAVELERRSDPGLLQSLIDRSPAAIHVKDLEGRFILVNRAVEEMRGMPAAEILGRTEAELAPEVAAELERNDRRVLESRVPMAVEEPAPGDVGDEVFLSVKFPLLTSRGEPYAVGAICTDITDRQRVQREAGLLAAARMVDIVDQVADGFVALDRDWRYTYLNTKAAAMFGRDRDSLLGKHIWTEFPEGVGQAFHRNYERAMREQKEFRFEDYYEPWDRWFENRLYPSEHGLAIFFTDITARRRNEEARRTLLRHLVDAQEAERGRIAAGIHDDTIQSLGGLGLWLDLLEERLDDPDARERALAAKSSVRESIASLRSLVFDLKPPALERGLAPALGELVRQKREEWGFELALVDRVEQEPGPEERTVIYRIAAEALTNAARHAGATRVELEVETVDGGVRLCVSDDGRGFAAEPGRPGHFGLTGMRERAELAGGRFEIESEPGSGTTIVAWVPVQEQT